MPGFASWTPQRLSPRAWYDAHLGGSTAGIVDLSGNNRAPMTVGAGSNAPQFISWRPPGKIYFPGVAGNNATTPYQAAFKSSDEYDVSFRGEMPAVPGGTYRSPCALGNGNVSGCYLMIRWASTVPGQLQWVSADGTSFYNGAHTYVGPTPGQTYWFRVTVKASTGAYAFYWAADQDNEPTSWTLGVSTTTSTWTYNAGTPSQMVVGDLLSNGYPYLGDLYRVIWRTAIGGPVVFDFDAKLATQTGFTDSTGYVWTINRVSLNRKTVVLTGLANSNRSVFLLGTDDWLDVPAAAIPALDTFQPAASVVVVCRRWFNPGSSGHAIFATKVNSAAATLGTSIRNALTSADPTIVVQVADGTINDGANGTSSLGTREVISVSVGSSSPFVSTAVNGNAAVLDTTRTTTTATTTGGVGRIGAYLGGTGAIDMEFEALLTFDRALTAAEHAQLVSYYRGGV